MKNVISQKQLPTPFPVSLVGVILLTLDRFEAPGWVWGFVGAVVLIFLASLAYAKSQENPIELQLDKVKGDKVDGNHGNIRNTQQGFHS